MAKKKKEKIIYVDDGRTIADMSGIGSPVPENSSPEEHGKPLRMPSSIKEHLLTFLDAIGFMLLPTLAICGLLAATFLIVYIIL